MSYVTMFFVYLVIWWIVFLPTLSLGVQNKNEAGDDRIEGTDPGAPSKANMGKKILITSVIAFLFTALFVYIEGSGLITFRK